MVLAFQKSKRSFSNYKGLPSVIAISTKFKDSNNFSAWKSIENYLADQSQGQSLKPLKIKKYFDWLRTKLDHLLVEGVLKLSWDSKKAIKKTSNPVPKAQVFAWFT